MLDLDGDTDTNHALFRQYMDTVGSWMSPDPYLGSYDPSNPQSMNRYSYVQNNPLGFVDPQGLEISIYGNGGSEDCANDPNCTQANSGYGWQGGSLEALDAAEETQYGLTGSFGSFEAGWSLALTGMEQTDSIMTFGGSTSDYVLLTPEYTLEYTGPTATMPSFNMFGGGGFFGGPRKVAGATGPLPGMESIVDQANDRYNACVAGTVDGKVGGSIVKESGKKDASTTSYTMSVVEGGLIAQADCLVENPLADLSTHYVGLFHIGDALKVHGLL